MNAWPMMHIPFRAASRSLLALTLSSGLSLANVSPLRAQSPLAIVLPAASSSQDSAADEEGFQPLFNGRDLEGWVVVNTAPSTWKFEDGMLVCSGKPIGEIRTEKMYQNFILEVEWRHMVPGGNAGIFVWADDITAKGQPFHRGIEVQVLENAYGNTRSYTTHGDIFPIHGATMNPVNGRGGSRAFPTEERSRPSPEWNHYRIECVDGRVTLAVNGKVVTEGRDCSPRKGYLCLESEGGVVHYRNARIKELPDTPIDQTHIAIANRGYRCLYNGIDLENWQSALIGEPQYQSRDWVLTHRIPEGSIPYPLDTLELFGEGGFLLDVKWLAETKRVYWQTNGSEASQLVLDPNDPATAELLNTQGWNRLEGTLINGQLSVTLNDQPWITAKEVESSEPGAFRIWSEGGADFANPFVRDAAAVEASAR